MITSITKRNVEFFGEDIAEYWNRPKPGRILFGLLDEERRPAGAAVLDLVRDTANIRYFAIADEFRGRGFGRTFMNGLFSALDSHFVSGLSFAAYADEEESRPEVFDFLERCGFTVTAGGTRRSVYDLKQVIDAAPFGKGRLPKDAKLIRGAMGEEDIRRQVSKIVKEVNMGDSYLDGELILSEKNRYGGIMTKDGRIVCMLSVVSFFDSIRLEGMYSDGKAFGELVHLFDYAVEAVRMEEAVPKHLYIDAAAGRLSEFEDRFMKKYEISRVNRLGSIIARKDREGE